jgi:GTP cyclohydrolase I
MEGLTIRSSIKVPEWARNGRVGQPACLLEDAFTSLILAAEGADANREGLAETPERAARAWRELTAGYRAELDLKTFSAEGYDEIVVVRDLPFYSMCEHHCLPFWGKADFAYLPDERILGLSKFARLLEHYSRRLQVQERMTTQIAEHLVEALRPQGVGVVVRAEHLCMAMRGVQRPGHTTVTSVMRGAFRDQPETRSEALALMGAKQ